MRFSLFGVKGIRANTPFSNNKSVHQKRYIKKKEEEKKNNNEQIHNTRYT